MCNVNLQRVIITQINSSENCWRVIDYTLALCTWMRTCLVTWTHQTCRFHGCAWICSVSHGHWRSKYGSFRAFGLRKCSIFQQHVHGVVGAHCKALAPFLHIWAHPIRPPPPTGTRLKRATIWQIGRHYRRSYSRIEHFWATLSVKSLVPLLCEQWSVIFLSNCQYEQNLDDDNDRRGQSETLWGWRLNTKGQAESHVAWISNF